MTSDNKSSYSVEVLAKELYSGRKEKPGSIYWLSIYNTTLITDVDFGWLVNKAFPHEVTVNHNYYKNYEEIDNWINENCQGRHWQTNIHYRFELKDDAIEFKLRWS